MGALYDAHLPGGICVDSVEPFAAQAVRSTLGRSTDVDSCAQLASRVTRLLEQAAVHLQSADARLACRAGCSFCCHLRVHVLPYEAIALFRYLQSRMPAAVADQVRDALRRHSASPREGPRPCAFLVDGRCAAYEVRPGACAAYHSTSKERCEQSFRDPAVASGTVALQGLQAVALALESGIDAAVVNEGLNNTALELHTAVAALLADPGLIARWRAGRPLLRGHA
jgi:Fe-S-cluster containining protein